MFYRGNYIVEFDKRLTFYDRSDESSRNNVSAIPYADAMVPHVDAQEPLMKQKPPIKQKPSIKQKSSAEEAANIQANPSNAETVELPTRKLTIMQESPEMATDNWKIVVNKDANLFSFHRSNQPLPSGL